MLNTTNDQKGKNEITPELLNAYIREAEGEVNPVLEKEVHDLEAKLPEPERLKPDSTLTSEMQFLRNLNKLANLGKKDAQEEPPAKTPGMS